MAKRKEQNDKQWTTNYQAENKRSSNANHTKTGSLN
jgi:hypothetical protein